MNLNHNEHLLYQLSERTLYNILKESDKNKQLQIIKDLLFNLNDELMHDIRSILLEAIIEDKNFLADKIIEIENTKSLNKLFKRSMKDGI